MNSNFNNAFKLYSSPFNRPQIFNEADETDGPQWVVQFSLSSDYDDTFDTDMSEITIIAPDIETAMKYAQQYIRKQQLENDQWKTAEIVSIEQQ